MMKKACVILGSMLCSIVVFGQQNSTIPFVEAKKYFIKNTFVNGSLKNPKIKNQEKFDEIFGMATVMGDDKPTVIDFAKQYVIAVIEDKTNKKTSFESLQLMRNKRKIIFEYTVRVGEEQSFTTRPFILLVVDKKYKGRVMLHKSIIQ